MLKGKFNYIQKKLLLTLFIGFGLTLQIMNLINFTTLITLLSVFLFMLIDLSIRGKLDTAFLTQNKLEIRRHYLLGIIRIKNFIDIQSNPLQSVCGDYTFIELEEINDMLKQQVIFEKVVGG